MIVALMIGRKGSTGFPNKNTIKIFNNIERIIEAKNCSIYWLKRIIFVCITVFVIKTKKCKNQNQNQYFVIFRNKFYHILNIN